MSPNSQGIDTIGTIKASKTVFKMVEEMGLIKRPMPMSHKRYEKIHEEIEAEHKQRRNKEKFTPIIYTVNLPKVDPKDKYLQIVIILNTPILWDISSKKKKAKNFYCMVVFSGLHQPTKKINSEAMKIISKFLKRKTFILHRLDIAKDIIDPKPIDKEGLKAFKERFKPYSNGWVVLPQKNSKTYFTSYYINHVKHRSIFTILYYDKYNKSIQKKENVNFKNRHWKRLEVRLIFDVSRPKSLNFMDYINSNEFLNDFLDLEEMAKNAKIKKYSNDYLEYQINSLIDNRFMNNKQSRKQFNLSEALEHFNKSEFRRYVLPI